MSVRVLAPAAPGLAPREEIDGIQVRRFRYAPSRFETLAYTGNMVQDVTVHWPSRVALAGMLASEFTASAWQVREFRPDIIHAHWWFPSGLIAAGLAAGSGLPLVTTLHGTDARLAKRFRASRPLLRTVLRRSAHVTTVSNWLSDELRALAPSVAMTVAPMPVATEKFTPAGTRAPDRFLFAGRLNAQKGLDHLLRAFAAMKQAATLDVVGEGKSEAELRLLASQLGISDRIRWHGQLTQEGLIDRYRSATALVVPSIDEGLGLVAAEALLCETPVIAFRSGGLTDIVIDNQTGRLVIPGDTAKLAGALDDVMESPDRAAALAKAGRERVLSHFSPESAAAQYAGIYRKAIDHYAS